MEMQFSMKEHLEDTFVSETGATSVARTRKLILKMYHEVSSFVQYVETKVFSRYFFFFL